jgi:hypothetical protein
VVFGKIIAETISVDTARNTHNNGPSDWSDEFGGSDSRELVDVSRQELATHSNADSCWVAIDGKGLLFMFPVLCFSFIHRFYFLLLLILNFYYRSSY